MKKTIMILSLILMSFFMLKSPILAQETGVISVSAEASEYAIPDTLHLSVEFQNIAKDSKAAMQKNNQTAQKIYDALKTNINVAQGDEIQTSHISLRPLYKYPKNKSKQLTGYLAKNSINIKTQQTNLASKLISVALSNGANKINNLYFKLENKDKYCNKLIRKSVEKAHKNAQTVAKSLGTTLAGIKNIHSHCGSGLIYRPRMLKAAGATNSENLQTPISPKKVKIEATTNAEFYVKN